MVEAKMKVAILERETEGWGRNYREMKEGGGRLRETGGEVRLRERKNNSKKLNEGLKTPRRPIPIPNGDSFPIYNDDEDLNFLEDRTDPSVTAPYQTDPNHYDEDLGISPMSTKTGTKEDGSPKTPGWVDVSSDDGYGGQVHQEHGEPNRQRSQNRAKPIKFTTN
ncbi:Py-PIP1-1 mRNA for plasma membrane intrinsic protein 1-1 [Pyrus ussuriensis x Pyrus communis]|uniref:Py-PIP1-1 mRNA for plasma membrane intrinsic protein 1-1 n=1 Tax=Pyrus ussuriensis x Pyrus communis TaxID=2448454 RepID=A0A5N5FS18_9ROSA|nr:Py-PIP1-1 mRNA for plasma membrane intrinsic protein 1-1 [Pyrus ussuriensis x Pyrus communis]